MAGKYECIKCPFKAFKVHFTYSVLQFCTAFATSGKRFGEHTFTEAEHHMTQAIIEANVNDSVSNVQIHFANNKQEYSLYSTFVISVRSLGSQFSIL